jgi:hypothetical protein
VIALDLSRSLFCWSGISGRVALDFRLSPFSSSVGKNGDTRHAKTAHTAV